MNDFMCIILRRASGMLEGSIWSSFAAASAEVNAGLSADQSMATCIKGECCRTGGPG